MTTIPRDPRGLIRVRPHAMPGAGNSASISARQGLETIVYHLRSGTRPSLVGQIPGLTPKMEKAFRSGQFRIIDAEFEGKQLYQLLHTWGGATLYGCSWSAVDLPAKPSESEKERGLFAFSAWKQHEVGFLDGGKGHTKEILKLLPRHVIESGVITRINLTAEERSGASRFGRYDPQTREIDIFDCYSVWDRYLLTVVLLHELGHAVYASLTAQQKMIVEGLHKIFWLNGAVFGTDFWGMSESVRIGAQDDINEFFAENLMHYLILGRAGMVGTGQHAPLRQRLHDFYLTQVFKP